MPQFVRVLSILKEIRPIFENVAPEEIIDENVFTLVDLIRMVSSRLFNRLFSILILLKGLLLDYQLHPINIEKVTLS